MKPSPGNKPRWLRLGFLLVILFGAIYALLHLAQKLHDLKLEASTPASASGEETGG